MPSVAVASLLFALSVSTPQAQTPASEPPVVVASGDATVRRAPDRAWITVTTEVRDGKAAEARRKNAEAMTAVQAALKTAGVSGDAIRTTGFTLQPEMEYSGGRPSVRNYVVRNQAEVRVDDLDKLADVIDAANSTKNVAITISNPRYELKDREVVELEAVRAAVAVAMARARAMADGAGQAIVGIVRIQQGGVAVVNLQSQYPRAAGAAGRGGGAGDFNANAPASVETPITPGDLEIRASVTVTAAIRNK